MKKLLCTTMLIVIAGSVGFIPAQQDKKVNSTNTSSEVKSADLIFTGDKIMQPLLEIWYEACPDEIPDIKIKFDENSVDVDFKKLQTEQSAMIMYSGTGMGLPEEANLWQIKVAREAVVPVFNATSEFAEQVKEKGLTQDQLIRIFTSGNPITWGELLDTENSDPVHVFMLDHGDGASDVWARFLFTQADKLKGRVMETDENMVQAIVDDPLAIGFCNLKYAYDLSTKMPVEQLCILPLDLNVNGKVDYMERIPEDLKSMQRVIWLGSYPNNLCRPLWLVAKEKPEDSGLQNFLNWILTDGQNLACDNGYCRLRTIERNCQLNCLKPKEIE